MRRALPLLLALCSIQASAAAQTITVTSAPALRYFTQPANSGAVAFAIGERFSGPAAVTVGWMGAKKQLVLPSGEWVVLAASDSRTLQAMPPLNKVSLTTVALGKFAGRRLISLLRFNVSTQIATVASWTDVDGCDRADPAPLRKTKSEPNLPDACMSVRVEADPLSTLAPRVADETRHSIDRLGATVAGSGLITTITMSDRRRGYWNLSRTDWPGAALGADFEKASDWQRDVKELSPRRAAYVKALWAWALQYQPHAAEGFRNESGSSSALADDFDPFSVAAAR